MIPFPEPRPLYGLDRLKGSKLSTVVIVEGEKCADAAQPFFDFPVLSWPGGSNGIGHVDWTPLKGKKPLIWPDADEPGAKAAEGRWNDRRGEVELGVAQFALAAGAEAVRVIQVPSDVAKGWDVADAIAEGWDKKRLLAFVKANLREPTTPCAPPQDPTFRRPSPLHRRTPMNLLATSRRSTTQFPRKPGALPGNVNSLPFRRRQTMTERLP
ncbi:MAG: hypothetical protein HQL34_08650 [Alphaproteobacteria bacterium]|nr:hypothetical protein [Alphaproteobacteria bacterium]